MRVTEKGQVTIPKEIRDRLKIGPGSEVDFVADEKGARLVVISGAGGPVGVGLGMARQRLRHVRHAGHDDGRIHGMDQGAA